ncbi:hypothetical protein ASD04_09155 [Devosia sp. Root436]|uniref:DUF930 domain-containing protein n=1 Tax=Devosia sp. Root436 TaxID=1736537 RepID=UPI0006FD064E|nr:DUF930 domain-containing protein [Devosia sp. Root436]KQX38810.1 hypothetical protein ASD04_09155 [Devosia sp. Root436]
MLHSADTMVRWTLPVSVVIHGGLLAALLALAVPRSLERPAQHVISVELVRPAPQSPPPAVASAEPAPKPAAVPEAPPPVPTASADDGMIAATDFYAGGILADPANAEVRRNFPLLASSEQVTQLCNMEALEQLRLADPAVPADALVGYAFDSITVAGTVLDAPDGAVRSGGSWFHFRYHCAVTPDIAGVSAFEYALGAAVPPEQWEEHFLNGNDDWLN